MLDRVWNRTISRLFRLRRRRVSVQFQLTSSECGAACLAMILSYFGRKTSVAECRDKCSPGRDGLTARVIARAARQFGLRVQAFALEPPAMLHVPLPAIVHWNFNHFVVVEKSSNKGILIVDPAAGRRWVGHAEFDGMFTGVVLTFEPGIGFEPRMETARPLWRRYLGSMLGAAGVRAGLAQVLAASILLQVLGLMLPLFTKVMVDKVLPSHIDNIMPVLGLGMLMLVASQSTLGYLRSVLLIYLRGKLDSRLMQDFFKHLLMLPYSFFQQRTSGDLLMRLGSNGQIREVLTAQMLSALLDGTLVIGYLVLLMRLAPAIGFIVLGLGFIQAMIILASRGRLRNLAERELASKADEQSYLVEAMKGIALLKASGAEDKASDRWSSLFVKQLNVAIERSRFSALVDTGVSALRSLSPLLLLWYGAIQVLNGHLQLGTMLGINSLAASFLGPMTTLVSAGQQLEMIGAQLDRIGDVLEAQPEQENTMLKRQLRASGHIELRNISFRYDANAPLALSGITLQIEAGQKVALVGPTGSGKSTLAMLLLGLYQPGSGSILYDGVLLNELDYRHLRSQFGVVLQDPFLFSGSIRHNIAINQPDMPFAQVVQAAKLAAVHDDIFRMPMGYETIVSEDGTTLSGGQRQRLAIARALAGNPAVLVLDEATSHLDVMTEAMVDSNLNQLPCTRIVIAHRLSTIRNSDKIFVLDEGRVVEQGSHHQLIAANGCYATLVRGQFEKPQDAEPGQPPAAISIAGEVPASL
jgi:HlyB family type I secretion system ABC transporter